MGGTKRTFLVWQIRVHLAHLKHPIVGDVVPPLTPNAVELIPALGALLPRGGPVQDPVFTPALLRERGGNNALKMAQARARIWP